MDQSHIDNLLLLLSDKQLQFQRLHFSDFTKELAPRPATNSQKVQLPDHLKSMFQADTTLSVMFVSGKKYSFWHALLYVLLPSIMDKSWHERKNMIDLFIEQLDRKSEGFLNTDSITKKTLMSKETLRFRDNLPSPLLKYYVSSLFGINLILVDNLTTTFTYSDIQIDVSKPTVVLYQDDTPMFYPVLINGETLLTSDMIDVECLYQDAPTVNTVLCDHINQHTLKKYPDFYASVHELSAKELHIKKNTPMLQAMKLGELQALAKKYGLSLMKSTESNRLKQLTKAELIYAILQE